jgi:hypothetical protein
MVFSLSLHPRPALVSKVGIFDELALGLLGLGQRATEVALVRVSDAFTIERRGMGNVHARQTNEHAYDEYQNSDGKEDENVFNDQPPTTRS